MPPDVDDRATAMLRQALPELEDRYQQLVADYGEELMPFLVFDELADLVSDLVYQPTEEGEALTERSCEAIEAVAASDAPDRFELVAYGFIDGLGPDAVSRIWPWLGLTTKGIMTALQAGDLDPDSQLEQGEGPMIGPE